MMNSGSLALKFLVVILVKLCPNTKTKKLTRFFFPLGSVSHILSFSFCSENIFQEVSSVLTLKHLLIATQPSQGGIDFHPGPVCHSR